MRETPGPHENACCPATYSGAFGSRPFSITMSTRQGVKRFTAEWLPTRCRRTFPTKREATAFIKAHEKVAYQKDPT